MLSSTPVRVIDHINNVNLDLSKADKKRRHGWGLTDREGGEDEHERGIEITKNKVEIHLFCFNLSIM